MGGLFFAAERSYVEEHRQHRLARETPGRRRQAGRRQGGRQWGRRRWLRQAKSPSSLPEAQCPAACAGWSSAPSGWRLPAHSTSSAYVVRPCCSISRPWVAPSAFDRLARSSKNVVASQPANTASLAQMLPRRRRGVGGCDQSTGETPVSRLDRFMTAAGLGPNLRPTPDEKGVSRGAGSHGPRGPYRLWRGAPAALLPKAGSRFAHAAGGPFYA